MKMFSIVMTEELKWLFSCQSVDRALIQFLSALLLVFAFWEMCSFVQRDSHTCWALLPWPRLMQGAVEDKWKWWRLRDSRWSWPSDRVAEGQSLMHPFFLSKWFFCPSVFFPEIQGANGGVLMRAVWKKATSVKMGKMWAKSKIGYCERQGRNSECHTCGYCSLIIMQVCTWAQPRDLEITRRCPANLRNGKCLERDF